MLEAVASKLGTKADKDDLLAIKYILENFDAKLQTLVLKGVGVSKQAIE